VYGRGPWCEPHYRRVRRTGSAGDTPIGVPPAPPPCSVDGCDRAATERGLCHAHYLRTVRLGTTVPEQPLLTRGPGRDHGPPSRSRRSRALEARALAPYRTPCTVEGCGRLARARGWCLAHYKRWQKHGDVRADVPLRGAAGTQHVNKGYRIVCVPPSDRWLTRGLTKEAEHRLVMARALGRPLEPDESVHHRNGDRLDNRRDNLELWSRWQPSGQRVADKVAFAVDLLARYAPHRLRAADLGGESE
jgi:hypothetical protein